MAVTAGDGLGAVVGVSAIGVSAGVDGGVAAPASAEGVDAGADDGVAFVAGAGVAPELAAGDGLQAASSNASQLINNRACRRDRRFTRFLL